MNIWDAYESRVTANGNSKREAILKREQHMLFSKLPDNLSYHEVTIDDEPQNVAIINSDNLDEKSIFSTSKNVIRCGALVHWMDNYWLITELDANSEVYTKAKMRQCNYLLKWIDDQEKICEQWCIVEDGTKYLTGELEDRNFVVTRGDSRIAMTIAKNKDTVKFGRLNRFLIDDPDSSRKLSYALTKPMKLGWIHNGEGVYCFVLQEVQSTDDDNHELGIADYYKHFPDKEGGHSSINEKSPLIDPENSLDENGKKVWL